MLGILSGILGGSYRKPIKYDGGDRILMPINIAGIEVDSNNITGKKLAEIGKWALTGKEILDKQMKEGGSFTRQEGDYTDIGWLDMRVNEICRKGRL